MVTGNRAISNQFGHYDCAKFAENCFFNPIDSLLFTPKTPEIMILFTKMFGALITGYFAVVFTIAAVVAYLLWMVIIIPYHIVRIVYGTVRYGHFPVHVKRSAASLRIKF